MDGNDIEPAISENHNYMQIITLFAYLKHIITFLTCHIAY